jgi:hypothetical protein
VRSGPPYSHWRVLCFRQASPLLVGLVLDVLMAPPVFPWVRHPPGAPNSAIERLHPLPGTCYFIPQPVESDRRDSAIVDGPAADIRGESVLTAHFPPLFSTSLLSRADTLVIQCSFRSAPIWVSCLFHLYGAVGLSLAVPLIFDVVVGRGSALFCRLEVPVCQPVPTVGHPIPPLSGLILSCPSTTVILPL